MFSDQILGPVVKFITGKDLSEGPKQVFKAQEEKTKSTGGQVVTSLNNIMLSDELTSE